MRIENTKFLSSTMFRRTITPSAHWSRLANLLQVSSPEAKELGILLRDVLQVIAKASFIFIDAIDEYKKFDRSILLKVLQDLKISCQAW